MHIPDGFLPPSVYLGGYALTGGVTWYCLRRINRQKLAPDQQIPKASLLTAAFFIASLIHIPIPPTSIHFILNGLMGIVLGYYSFLAILIGLFFQAVMFGHGGLTSLGLNALVMGVPALIAYQVWCWGQSLPRSLLAFVTGGGAVMLSALIFTSIMLNYLDADLNAAVEERAISLALVAYGIQSIIEGFFTVILVSFLTKIRPELLEN